MKNHRAINKIFSAIRITAVSPNIKSIPNNDPSCEAFLCVNGNIYKKKDNNNNDDNNNNNLTFMI